MYSNDKLRKWSDSCWRGGWLSKPKINIKVMLTCPTRWYSYWYSRVKVTNDWNLER